MASGRIHPGSRQWVDAMRRLSETTDTTVDMSMGRKVSRDAIIPHGVGTAALDTRLRGGGGDPGDGSIDNPFDATNLANFPVGNEWVRILAYTFVDLGPGSGGVRLGIWVELTGAGEPVLFRQIASSQNLWNGFHGIAILATFGSQVISFTDANDRAAFFSIEFPAGMVAGDVLPVGTVLPPPTPAPPPAVQVTIDMIEVDELSGDGNAQPPSNTVSFKVDFGAAANVADVDYIGEGTLAGSPTADDHPVTFTISAMQNARAAAESIAEGYASSIPALNVNPWTYEQSGTGIRASYLLPPDTNVGFSLLNDLRPAP